MATYEELFKLRNASALKNRVAVAVAIAAEKIRIEDSGTANHVNRLIWAKQAMENPERVGEQVYFAILAANKDATVAQITSATDAAIQSNVDAAVDLFAQG